MSEVIMRYSGSGEDLHNLKWVGELVRYNCPFYERDIAFLCELESGEERINDGQTASGI